LNGGPAKAISLATALGLAAFGLCAGEAPKLPSLDDFKIRTWYEDVNVRGGFGYKDNVLLSSTNQQGSAFYTAGGDVLVYRLPSHGWQINGFASFDHVGYFSQSTGVNDEQVAMALGQVTKELGQGWKMGLGANYMFQHQVFDVSATQTNQFTNGEVLGHNAGLRWLLRKEFKPYWVELELSGARQWLAAPLDSFWQMGPRLTVGRSYGRGSDLALSYQWTYVAFDSRAQVTADGFTEPGTHLHFTPQGVEAAWHHVWDQKKRWHTVTKAGLDHNQDNGAGYFDFWQYRLSEQIKFRAGTWELSATCRVGYFDFLTQTASATETDLRHKTLFGAGFRAEKTFGKSFKVFLAYAHEQSLSNAVYDRYRSNTFTIGAEYRF
jgi:hypothetical protein